MGYDNFRASLVTKPNIVTRMKRKLKFAIGLTKTTTQIHFEKVK